MLVQHKVNKNITQAVQYTNPVFKGAELLHVTELFNTIATTKRWSITVTATDCTIHTRYGDITANLNEYFIKEGRNYVVYTYTNLIKTYTIL